MSGIVGIINLDGTPVDRQLLQQMTQFIAYRGPDTQGTWVDGPVGFGHTLLRTTFESEREHQPFSLDGKVWIISDARVDGRKELIRKLVCEGSLVEIAPSPRLPEGVSSLQPSPIGRGNLNIFFSSTASRRSHGDETGLVAATDVELILRAYHLWGEHCVHQLLGDFAFAIWDQTRRRLFCARDHFGVKLFYYARFGSCLLFSNTLNCLRVHPAVSNELDDLAIADFLLFGFNQDKSTTTFAKIRRLPPAYTLTWSVEEPRLQRYWSLPVDYQIHYRRPTEYVEQFKEVLRTAVADRLRTERVGVYMSGGLDSTTLTATARELLLEQYKSFDLRAHTVVYDRLIPDDERYYSGLVAEALKIPIHYLVADDFQMFGDWEQPELVWPEPTEEPDLFVDIGLAREIASHCRVAFYGEDGDAILHPSTVIEMLHGIPVRRVLADVGRFILSHRRRPAIGLGIYAKLNRLLGRETWQPKYPTWLCRDFEARYGLRQRWKDLWNIKVEPVHPVRSEAHRRLLTPLWQCLFEDLDPGVTHVPLEVRLPFLDLRLINVVLSIPPLPWCVDKELLRVVMQGTLPEPVLSRPKTGLQEDPCVVRLKYPENRWVNDFEVVPELEKYVDRNALPQIAGQVSHPDQLSLDLRPVLLNHWLHHREQVN